MMQHVSVEPDGLTEEERRVLRTAYPLVLSKADHISALNGLETDELNSVVRNLLETGRLASVLQDRSTRWSPHHLIVTNRGLQELGVDGPTWHEAANRAQLLPRFPLVNPFYRAVGLLCRDLGPFKSFQWLIDAGLDAISSHERGWAGLMWSGTRETDLHFQGRLEALPQHLAELAITPEIPRPAVILVAAQDAWQVELVTQAARRAFFPPELLQIRCLDDEDWAVPEIHFQSIGEVRQPIRGRDLGGWTWESRLNQSIYARTGHEIRVVELLAEFGELSANQIKAAFKEGEKGRTTQRALTDLFDEKITERRRLGRVNLHRLTNRAVEQLRLRDGLGGRHRGENFGQTPGRLIRHETGLKDFLLPLLGEGIKVAFGTRSWEDMGKEGGGISPDAIIRLNHSPFGAGWHYFEYELTAQDTDQVSDKLNGSASPLRRDDFPLMLACADEQAERNFHAEGQRLGIRMITTTLARLRDHGALGNGLCWSHYGDMVQIR